MPPAHEPDSLPSRVERRLPEIYLVLALTITSLLCLMTAPFGSPDEQNQSMRAISLAHRELIAPLGPLEAGGNIDLDAQRVMITLDDSRVAWEKGYTDWLDRGYGSIAEPLQRDLAAVHWAHRRSFIGFGNTAIYPPALYLPAIVGWRVGEAADLSIFWSLRLARFLTAFTSVLLGWVALRRCACPRWALFALLILPSTLFLNATCSQDAILLSVAVLIASLVTRPLVARRGFTTAELAVIALLLAMCANARPPYLALALIFFLPSLELSRASPESRRSWVAPGLAFVAVAAACGLWMHLVAPLGYDTAPWANVEKQELFLRTHPLAAAAAVLQGTGEAGYDLFHRGLYVIGWNDLLPHHGAAAVLSVCLATVVLLAPAGAVRTWRGRAMLAIAAGAPLLGISLAEYLIWTFPGNVTVGGIQPRYWLPVLPVATLMVPAFFARPREYVPRSNADALGPVRSGVILGAVAVIAMVSCTLPFMAAHAFYRDTVVHVLLLNLR